MKPRNEGRHDPARGGIVSFTFAPDGGSVTLDSDAMPACHAERQATLAELGWDVLVISDATLTRLTGSRTAYRIVMECS